MSVGEDLIGQSTQSGSASSSFPENEESYDYLFKVSEYSCSS